MEKFSCFLLCCSCLKIWDFHAKFLCRIDLVFCVLGFLDLRPISSAARTSSRSLCCSLALVQVNFFIFVLPHANTAASSQGIFLIVFCLFRFFDSVLWASAWRLVLLRTHGIQHWLIRAPGTSLGLSPALLSFSCCARPAFHPRPCSLTATISSFLNERTGAKFGRERQSLVIPAILRVQPLREHTGRLSVALGFLRQNSASTHCAVWSHVHKIRLL
jgi:hypothetical protein